MPSWSKSRNLPTLMMRFMYIILCDSVCFTSTAPTASSRLAKCLRTAGTSEQRALLRLVREEPAFGVQTAAEAGERPVLTDDAVTGDD